MLFSFLALFSLFVLPSVEAQKKYVVILDAGHGGKDPGASNGNFIEKKIVLSVALEIGKQLKKNKDIKVVYTRDDDTFVELHKRASIANQKDAVLFVSLHCDSFKPNPKAFGASTYVLGLKGNSANMEIAKRENAVILLEDNYEQNYDYDPNSPESVIGLSVLQEENLDASLAFAGKVQNNFTKVKRKDRSVKQANFLVLRETVMPSVLIELGFLSNDNEGKYLNSKAGQKKLATAIAKAISEYINRLKVNTVKEQKQVVTKAEVKATPTPKKTPPKKVVKADSVQKIKAEKPTLTTKVAKVKKETPKKVVKVDSVQKTKKEKPTLTAKVAKVKKETPKKAVKVDSVQKTKKEKPTLTAKVTKVKKETPKKTEAKQTEVIKKQPKPKTVPLPYVEFKVQIAASKKYIEPEPRNFKGLEDIDVKMIDEYYKYYYGGSSDFQTIKEYLQDVKDIGIKDAFIVAFKDGIKISIKEALKK